MNARVSPVSIAMSNVTEKEEPATAALELRCKTCQLIVPCGCSSKKRSASELQLLNSELSEKQELAAETVRSMQMRKKSAGKGE